RETERGRAVGRAGKAGAMAAAGNMRLLVVAGIGAFGAGCWVGMGTDTTGRPFCVSATPTASWDRGRNASARPRMDERTGAGSGGAPAGGRGAPRRPAPRARGRGIGGDGSGGPAGVEPGAARAGGDG